ncbi:MAG: phospho-N-acetylmuramoyl-pentapeptide-transferase [Corallococcus sp.]|nr:phospho-N-acetylmuramoyl-pentapeptide-transferase [Corallococcus sp.]MCM1359280.1 phospho-N-acetylmuramoyl-pentapeptide-transferase [Corallococcus sp.]MCM1394672.1 phospho-N-acetylmuramoyl-pentapeptide-transferase [Corallococcus sp.]
MNTPLSFLVAFIISLCGCFALLPILKKAKAKQEILQYVTEHSSKSGTPTMGGIAFILAIVVTACIFCDLKNRGITVALAVFVGYAFVGFLDDFIKIKFHRNQGLYAYQKILVQLAIAVVVAVFVYRDVSVGDKLRLPFTDKQVVIGWWIIPLVIFIYLACTNGVNLTDGLDGLATSTTICYLAGIALLLQKELVRLEEVGDTYAYKQTKDVVVLCVLSVGALLAFLIFNANNAKVFMGDTGSLALGALVACTAIFTRYSLFIPIVGLMFVVSCASVILQVVYFKITKGKRIFLMAPYHHHLQKKGLSETRICVIYCCVTLITIAVLLCFGG